VHSQAKGFTADQAFIDGSFSTTVTFKVAGSNVLCELIGGRRQSIGKMLLTTSYGLNCPVARTLDIIGERWTLLILRDLFLLNSRRFQDFETALPGISPTTLSARLKVLEDNGIVERRFYEQHPPRAEYLLTPKGRALGPIMKALREWGNKY
jgi:DNA-binding HxlR family transcriptional regulator